MSPPFDRVISLCPSLTETIFALGAGAKVIGATRWCVHPATGVEPLPKLGGTKDPDLDGIRALRPDVVLMDIDENRREDAAALVAHGLSVQSCHVRTIDAAAEMVQHLGAILGREEAALRISAEIQAARTEATARCAAIAPLPAAYLIWRRPWMAAGRETYIDDLMRTVGFENILTHQSERYPELESEELAGCGLRVALLSTEPYRFRERHAEELQELCGLGPGAAPLVDGELFSWYGSRTPAGIRYASELLVELARSVPESGR